MALSFERVPFKEEVQAAVRPSRSYWQDVRRSLLGNLVASASLCLVVGLLLFATLGPLAWPVDPAAQDLDRVSEPPGADRRALVVEARRAWTGVFVTPASGGPLAPPTSLQVADVPSTESVRLHWAAAPGAAGYRVYRRVGRPEGRGLGKPLGDVRTPGAVFFEDRLDLKPGGYFYSVVAVDGAGAYSDPATAYVEVIRTTTVQEAMEKGLIAQENDAKPGDVLRLQWRPLGTDYLGRDMLARLMQGARVSLFIGIIAPFAYMLIGVFCGSIAGIAGGRLDQLLMRFADFVVALPFLLFMILFRILFDVRSGDSGIYAMMAAMVLLGWPAAARLVRGQILQIREEGYVGASRLIGARNGYLILRHMIPNTAGVVLVTFTFAVPSAIFTEAFLSFIGMGVAAPTASWGSMCNEGLKTMLATPHELIAPAVFVGVAVLAFNLLGDGLRDALDARTRTGTQ